MKTLGLICISLLWTCSSYAQLDTVWTRVIDVNSTGAQLSIDGAAIVLQTGETMVSSARYEEAYINLWRLSVLGETIWTGSVEVPSPTHMIGMVQMDEGYVVLVGYYHSQAEQTTYLMAKAVDLEGEVLWTWTTPMNVFASEGDVCKLADNSIAVFSTRNDLDQAVLVKLTSDGTLVWTIPVSPDDNSSEGRDVEEFSNGDLAVAGVSISPTGHESGYLMRLTSVGEPIWTRTYETTAQFGLTCNALAVDDNDNILVAGSKRVVWWESNPWAKKLTGNGDETWALSQITNENCETTAIRFQPDGGIMLLGNNIPVSVASFAVLYLVSPEGEETGPQQLGGSTSSINGISDEHMRGAVAYGSIAFENMIYQGLALRFGSRTLVTGYVRELDTNFPVPHTRIELVETGESVVTDQEGHYALSIIQANGTLRVTNPCIEPIEQTVTLIENETNELDFTVGLPEYQCETTGLNMIAQVGISVSDTVVVENLGNGDLIFFTNAFEQTPIYGWLSVSPATGVIEPGQSAEIVVSVLADAEHTETDFFGQAQIHHNACPDTVSEIGVFVSALDSPERPGPVSKFALHPAYPNPFNNTARVAFDLPQTAQVNAKLYSIDGREAATLANGQYTAGRHEVSIEGDALATGVYLLRLTAGSAVATQKLVLLK